MNKARDAEPYHSLIDLHHLMRLRRSLRGEHMGASAESRVPDGQWRPEAYAPTLDNWPERLDDQWLLRESLRLLEPVGETLVHLYPLLFEHKPYLRPLFPQSLEAQKGRLERLFRTVIDALDQPESLVEMLAQLGRDHRKLGVRAAHYAPFSQALILALRQRGGPDWQPEYEQAWSRTYWFMARAMIDASETAVTEAAYVTATIVRHEPRRPDLAVITLRTRQPYPYRAGQYATMASGLLPRSWRSYSMTNTPSASGTLEFHVRRTCSGGLSEVLVDKVGVGDTLRLGPARGTMTLPPRPARPILMIAGGTGLAPMLALLGELADQPVPPPVWLFVGARTQDDLYALAALEDLASRYGWLRVLPVISDEPANPYHGGLVSDVAARQGDWSGHDVYLAGPAEMVTATRQRLLAANVPAAQIRSDDQ